MYSGTVEALVAFFTAAIGLGVIGLHVRQHWKSISNGDLIPLLVVLISLLCTAYGVERWAYSDNYRGLLTRLDQALAQQPRATFTDDVHDVWNDIARAVLSVDHTIRTVQSGDRPNEIPAEFSNLPERIRDRLAEQQARFGDVRYEIVLVFEGANIGADRLAEIESANRARVGLYKEKGLEHNVELRIFDHETLTKFDILIIDDKHVNIGFDTSAENVSGNVKIQNTMLWENEPILAHKLARWFDATVWQQARPFEKWLEEQKQRLATSH